MSSPRREDLSVWTDADELFELLEHVSAEQHEELQDALAKLLEHSDSDVRQEVLRILFVEWKTHDLHDAAVAALLEDPEPEVRAVASFGVAATSSAATHESDTRALLRVLQDESQPTFVRGTVYEGLLIIHRKRQFPNPERDFRPDSDIDWEWIASLDTSRGGSAV